MVPFVAPLGDSVLSAMYVLRVVDAALVGLLAALTAGLAAQWAPPGRETLAAWFGGGAVAVVPAVAEAGARVNNDMLVAVLVTAVLVACTALLRRPSTRMGWSVGALAAAAVLTKASGIVAIAVVVATLVLLARDRRFRLPLAATALVPSLAAVVAWAVVVHERYGVWRGDSAFLALARPFVPLPFGQILSRTLRQGLFPYGQWGVPLIVPIVVVVVVAVGVGLATRQPRGCVLAVGALLVLGVVAAGYLEEIHRGLVTVSARLLVPSYPGLLAAVACGYASLRRREIPMAIIALGGALAAAFFVLAFLPRFPFRVG
jgi:4-amino-4-deoxy-L-arabinose transferase-like glycosyltransferase